MGADAPAAADVVAAAAAGSIKLRATCVMTRGQVENTAGVWQYINAFRSFGITEFTFKHTYVAYEHSLFQGTDEDRWTPGIRSISIRSRGVGEPVGGLPWGPLIRRKGATNMLLPRADARVGAETSTLPLDQPPVERRGVCLLEDQSSLLYRLGNS